MKFIGAHVSASGGVEAAPVNASEIGANAFALFTKNQRQWVERPLTEESIRVFKENCGKLGFDSRYIPVSYTHLDVYKRQLLYHPVAALCHLWQEYVHQYLTKRFGVPRQEQHKHCLLYTSSCV